MKTTQLFTLCSVLLLTGRILAQDKPSNPDPTSLTTIVIDLYDDNGIGPIDIKKYNSLKKGHYFRIKIEPVNTY
ncbi:MAG: hypothetical protein WA913_13515, partial [Pricia sp.]